MNREIKFRAWDGYRKMMVPFDEAVAVFHDGRLSEIHPELRVMQFTGLRDKNGKEVWEGDIVIDNVKTEMDSYMPIRGEVFYNSNVGSFDIRPCNAPQGMFPSWTIGLNCEVIGNIYENPELLK